MVGSGSAQWSTGRSRKKDQVQLQTHAAALLPTHAWGAAKTENTHLGALAVDVDEAVLAGLAHCRLVHAGQAVGVLARHAC